MLCLLSYKEDNIPLTSFWTNKCRVEGTETGSHKNALNFSTCLGHVCLCPAVFQEVIKRNFLKYDIEGNI